MYSSVSALWVCVCAAWLASGGARGSALGAGEEEAGALRDCAGAEFALETGALVAEAGARAGEAGWLLRGTLRVAVLWPPPPPRAPHPTDDLLLRFELDGVRVLGRGAGARAEWRPRGSLWDAPAHARAEFFAHWRRGAVLSAYLDRDDHPDVANYKRSLISLFQFQMLDGERNETDISGNCSASYESLSPDHLRKTKERCSWGGAPAPEWVSSRRVTRYTLAGARLAAVRAHETHEAGAGGAAAAGVKARAWTALERREPAAAPAPAPLAAADLRAALAALPDRFQPASLEMPVPDEPQADEKSQRAEVAEAVREWEAAEGGGGSERAGGGGVAGLARAALRLLPLARRPPARDLLLSDHKDLESVMAGARVAGLAGAALPRRLAALRDAPPAVAAAYLHAFAVSPHPDETVTQQLLSLGESDASPVGRAALLAGAAAARRLPAAAAAAARARLAAALANCKDDECRELRVQALGNLRHEDTAALLLEQAESGARCVALAALEALRGLPERAMTPPRRQRLLRVALEPAARALEVRALALDLAAARAHDLPVQLADAAIALRDARGGGAELRRVLHGRVATLALGADADPALGQALRPASWAAAAAGDSAVLARAAGWGGGGWHAALDSLQLAARGVLRRGAVRLALLPPGAARPDPEHDVLAVQLGVRGMAALAGAAAQRDDRDDDDDDVGGEIGIELMGARLPTISLFSSQAELLGHVWAGSGSEPLPVVRALLAAPAQSARLPLLAGAPLTLTAAAAAHLALDAQMAVSLWSRTARGGLALRAGAAARAGAALRAAWGGASARADAASEPRLTIDIDLDFYTRTALCVRVATDDHDYRRNVTLESVVGAREWRVRRRRAHVHGGAGRTLALTRDTHAACRLLQPAH